MFAISGYLVDVILLLDRNSINIKYFIVYRNKYYSILRNLNVHMCR